jgi:hypothetical protein
MLISDNAVLVDHKQGRHTTELPQVDLLIIDISHCMFRVRYTNKGKFLAFPITTIGIESIRSDGQDCRVTRGERRILVPQAGEMGTAVGSHKPTQKSQYDMLPFFVIRKSDCLPLEIIDHEVWSSFSQSQFCFHRFTFSKKV